MYSLINNKFSSDIRDHEVLSSKNISKFKKQVTNNLELIKYYPIYSSLFHFIVLRKRK